MYTLGPEHIAYAKSIGVFDYRKLESKETSFAYGLRNVEGDTTFPRLMAK